METPNLNQLLPSIFCLLNQELRPGEFNYSFEDHIFVLMPHIRQQFVIDKKIAVWVKTIFYFLPILFPLHVLNLDCRLKHYCSLGAEALMHT